MPLFIGLGACISLLLLGLLFGFRGRSESRPKTTAMEDRRTSPTETEDAEKLVQPMAPPTSRAHVDPRRVEDELEGRFLFIQGWARNNPTNRDGTRKKWREFLEEAESNGLAARFADRVAAEVKGIEMSQAPQQNDASNGPLPSKPPETSARQPSSTTPRQADDAKEKALKKERTLDLGDGIKMEFVLIPPGTFMMGVPPEERGPYEASGKPQHVVTLTRAFYLGKHEVTQAQYERVTGSNPSRRQGADLPVGHVSWHDCEAFCRKLSDRTGRKVRLPTEAEWEHACRAGTTTRFSFGDSDAEFAAHGWCRDNSGGRAHPVGRKKPNKLGLFDLHGNVWEWCNDWYAGYSAGALTDPKGPSTGKGRVRRGGSWATHPALSRSAARGYDAPGEHFWNHGFRVALDF
jgi:formylglycine-generating enzyme required for sulfatase activity